MMKRPAPSKNKKRRPTKTAHGAPNRASTPVSVIAKARPRAPKTTTETAAPRPTPPVPVRADAFPERHLLGARFPIVGVGASAGGLEAFDLFLKHLPAKTGMAFVLVQHLDPGSKGMLPELLQRATPMPVVEATERLRIEPNHVYVIPPNRDLSVLHGVLHLLPKPQTRGVNLSIDFFFRALAEDQQESAVGVVLSGMGTDGTLGLRAIKERAGAAFVQSLDSAKFDSMPRSAIDAGLADVIAPAEALPARIIAYREHYLIGEGGSKADKTQSALEKVCVLLRTHTGNDFSLYKQSTVLRRIERRMGLHQIDTVANYVRYLREVPHELDLLFRELLIGVTNFFRDPPTWEYLRTEVLPALVASRASGGVLRAWVAGCSTGEEAVSLAISFREAVEPFRGVRELSLQIFATDLDRDAIEKARRGVYPANIAADISSERLQRWFSEDELGYRVSKEIREMIVFAPQNIITDPPFTKLDLICCRNVLIYFSPELQKRVIPLFHYSLAPGGVLFLGTAETVGNFTNLFTPLDSATRIYKRLDHSLISIPIDFPATLHVADEENALRTAEALKPKSPPPNLQALTDRLLAEQFAPVGVLCNDKGDILYTSGRTAQFLEPAVGKANLNIFAMAKDGLRRELPAAFTATVRNNHPIVIHGIKVPSERGPTFLDLRVQKITEPKELRGAVLVVFAEAQNAPAPTKGRRADSPQDASRIVDLEQELFRTREDAQTIHEEMQTSQEELKSTNEELQSTNEELQSTNEELTTSKEELQSLNEELQTLNHELQSKLDDLSRSNKDMKNLLNSTDIATLFLDGELCVRRFTTRTTRIIKLIATDAGRPITDITSELEYPELADDAREVLQSLIFKERHAKTRDGRWFFVRILPYRTMENVIDGVVLTFADATAIHALEAALRDQAGQFRQIGDSLPILVWRSRPDGAFDYIGRQWIAFTGVPEDAQLGHRWLEQVHPEDRERVRDTWRTAVKLGTAFDAELRLKDARDGYRWFRARAVAIRDGGAAILHWYGTATDVHDARGEKADGKSELGRAG